MNNEDVARAAEFAPHLRSLVVFSFPDNTVLGEWGKEPFDAQGLAARMGTFLRASQVVAKGVGHTRSPRAAWLDGSEGAIFVVFLGASHAVGFLFDAEVALGLARVEAHDVVSALRGSAELRPEATAKPGEGAGPPPTSTQAEPSSSPRTSPNHQPLAGSEEDGSSPWTGLRTEFDRPSASLHAGPPRAARLLEFLRRYAPDPHVTLLRLSLRTGIPLDQLDRPEELNESQVEKLADSVRDMIGQEQLGV